MSSDPPTPAMVRAFVANPDSQATADSLNAAGDTLCGHGRNPCFLRCGVRRKPGVLWTPIPKVERFEWLRRLAFQVVEEQKTRGQPEVMLCQLL